LKEKGKYTIQARWRKNICCKDTSYG